MNAMLSLFWLLLGTQDVVTYMLILMNVLFFVVVITYLLLRVDRRKKQYQNFIKGTWLREGKSTAGEDWHINYVFGDGTFEIKAIPELHMKGRYKIVKEVERLVVLELFNIEGNGETQKGMLNLGVDPKSDQMTIEDRLFMRVKS